MVKLHEIYLILWLVIPHFYEKQTKHSPLCSIHIINARLLQCRLEFLCLRGSRKMWKFAAKERKNKKWKENCRTYSCHECISRSSPSPVVYTLHGIHSLSMLLIIIISFCRRQLAVFVSSICWYSFLPLFRWAAVSSEHKVTTKALTQRGIACITSRSCKIRIHVCARRTANCML